MVSIGNPESSPYLLWNVVVSQHGTFTRPRIGRKVVRQLWSLVLRRSHLLDGFLDIVSDLLHFLIPTSDFNVPIKSRH